MNFQTTLRIASIALAAALAQPAAAETAATLPDAGGQAFIQAFNRAERGPLTAWVRRHFSEAALAERSADERVDELLNAHQAYGDLKLQEVSGVARVSVLNVSASRQPQDADVVVVRSDAHPEQIAEVYIHPVEPDATVTAAAATR
ncbi:MAG TPA: hypothetical protein VLI06_11360 [Solimonas sp.]|nr:hypothetical protein [Solimonas sp.]